MHAVFNLTETKLLWRKYTKRYDKEAWHPTEGKEGHHSRDEQWQQKTEPQWACVASLLCFSDSRFRDSRLQTRLQQDSTVLPAEIRTLVFALLHSQPQQVPGFCSLSAGLIFTLLSPCWTSPQRSQLQKKILVYNL